MRRQLLIASAGLPVIVASGVVAAGLLGDGSALAASPSAHAHAASAHDVSRAASRSVHVQVENAWIPQPPPGADVAAAYFTLRNTGSEATVLVGIDSPAAAEAMLHQSSIVAGQSRMRMVDRLTVVPGTSVTLEPRGLHVMLEGLKGALEVGQQVPLVLHFAGGGEIHVSARVRPLGSQ